MLLSNCNAKSVLSYRKMWRMQTRSAELILRCHTADTRGYLALSAARFQRYQTRCPSLFGFVLQLTVSVFHFFRPNEFVTAAACPNKRNYYISHFRLFPDVPNSVPRELVRGSLFYVTTVFGHLVTPLSSY